LQVSIDPHSGFCFGVVHAIEVAERELRNNPMLYCLGDIVHNNMEVSRLKQMGLVIISHEELEKLHDCTVLIRAHGEPPETYRTALFNNIELIDASCPIVLHLQNVIHQGYLEMKSKNGQIVIYGKEGHAEVNGLKGQTNGTAIVIGDEQDLSKINFSRPVRLYTQTTMSMEGFHTLISLIREKMESVACGKPLDFEWYDSICRQVSNRSGQLRNFAARFDVVIFVSGKKSSNGMILYKVCKEVNKNTHLVSSQDDLLHEWFEKVDSVGICGATSTPMWLMEEMEREILKFNH
jgi:4-hydroxy-3-methylbut-2-enyl diphosphate reductase